MRVNTDELQRQADEMRRLMCRIGDIQDALHSIIENLGAEQFGEKFRAPLKSAADAAERRGEELSRLRTALQQISREYSKTETQIADAADHALIRHVHTAPVLVQLPPWDVSFSGGTDAGIDWTSREPLDL